MTDSKLRFSNFKDAYCAYTGCKPERFLRHALVASIPMGFRPIAILTLKFNPRLFAAELDVIAQMGQATSGRQIGVVVEELDGLRRVERSFWRGIGLRSDGRLLYGMWEKVKDHVVRANTAQVMDMTIRAPSLPSTAAKAATTAPAGGTSAVVLRKLRQVHSEYTQGKSVPEALAAVALSEPELLRLLGENASGNPALSWLRDQILRNNRLAELEAQNAEMARTIAAQSMELARLRGSSSR